MTTTAAPDAARSAAFVEKLKATYNAGMLTMMINLGHETGLWEALAQGPGTSAELAQRASLSERHVREWLGSVTVGGVVEYDAPSKTYSFPQEHAFWLTGPRYTNLAPMSGMVMGLAQRLDDVAVAFRNGGGVPYDNYRPHFTHSMDVLGRAKYDELLVNAYLPSAPGLIERLSSGVDVADVGCGTGHCLNLMAAAFPASRFVGFDFSSGALELARAEAQRMGLGNVRFDVADVRHLPTDPGFDVIFAFDAIHDQADPAGVLGRIREALHVDGMFFMVDIKASSHLEDNLAEPATMMMYGMSVLHCMEVSLAYDGAGLGTVWGTQLATAMLHDAGFGDVIIHDIRADPSNCIYVCR